MKKTQFLLAVVGLVLALVLLSGTAVFVSAQGGGGGSGDQDRTQDRDQIRDPTKSDGTGPDQIQQRDQDRDRLQSTTSTTSVPDGYQNREQTQQRSGDTTADGTKNQERLQLRATSSDHLKLMIRERERELADNASDTNAHVQERTQNENRVRTAVHALLAAEDLLGPMGQQVREIARSMEEKHNRVVEVETALDARGFLAHFFFGGDTLRAEVLAGLTAENKVHIEEVQRLLETSTISTEVRAELQTRLEEALREQERLEIRAQEEQGDWGIFSWRF